MRQFANFFGIAIAFNHLTNLLLRAFYIAALSEHHAKAAVTRLVIGAGQHQVAQPCHSHKGGRIGTQRFAQAGHFGQATGDQRSTRIRAETDAVRHPGPDGNDVLHRAAQLHADKIGIAVHAEAFAAMQQLLKIVGKCLVGGRQRNRRRQARSQLFGKRRPGDHRQRDRCSQRFAGNVLQQTSGFRFQPLRRPYNTRIRTHQRLNLTQDFAKHVAWHHNQNIAAGRQRGREVAFQIQRVRERNVREKRHVAAVVLQRRDMFWIVAPQDHVVTISCQRDGKSGAVRAGTDHSH